MENGKNLIKWIEEQEKNALAFGFYWETIDQLLEQITSECKEVKEAWEKNDKKHLQEEVGDLMQAAVSLAIFCQLDPEETLQNSILKFQSRYEKLIECVHKDGLPHLKGQPSSLLLHYWRKAKQS